MKKVLLAVLLLLAFLYCIGTATRELASSISRLAAEHERAVEENLKFIKEIEGR